MSLIITRTWVSFSNAKYSAAVSATRGVIILSIAGSSAKLIYKILLFNAPLSSNDFRKNAASLFWTPIAAKTTANSSPLPGTVAWRAIWAAKRLCGSPAPEKIGNFWPLTRVLRPSIDEIPVWIKSSGKSLRSGFIDSPFISRNFSPTGSGRPSIGLPRPSNTLPNNWSVTGISIVLPKNRVFVSETDSPVVPSKTWTTAVPPPISRTRPKRFAPAGVVISTSSSNAELVTPLITNNGPLISEILVYSKPEDLFCVDNSCYLLIW